MRFRIGILAGFFWLLTVIPGGPGVGEGRGAELRLPPGGARRVVLYEAYEMAAALGAFDRVAGISRYARDNDLLTRLVPHLSRIPTPGSGFDVNLEALHALKPDLVVIWSRRPDLLDFLERQGFQVLAIYPETLAELQQDLLRLGEALGKAERAREVARLMEGHLKRLNERVAPLAAQGRPRVVWLWGKPTTISGRRGVVPELMALAGGQNLGAHLDVFNQEVSMETLAAMDPEVVVIWGSASYRPEDLLQDPKWQSVTAIKKGRVFKAGRASTWSPRIVALAWWLAHWFYPDSITRTETLAAVDQFYRECFGIPYQEER